MRNVSLNLGSVRLAAAAMRGRCAGRRPALRPRAGPRCWRGWGGGLKGCSPAAPGAAAGRAHAHLREKGRRVNKTHSYKPLMSKKKA